MSAVVTGLEEDERPPAAAAPGSLHDATAPETAPGITVVIPCYNYAWLVEDAVRSVLAQTLPATAILVIDDGSTLDDPAEELAELLAVAPQLKVIRQENRGLAGARNRGLHEARTEFVAFLDADDIWHPDFLAETAAALQARPAAPYAFAYSFRFGLDNRLYGFPLWRFTPRHDFVGMLTLNLVGNGSAALFRRAAVLAVGGFDETMRQRGATGSEDWKLVATLAAAGPPALIPRALVGYRYVGAGMSQGDPRRQMRSIRMTMEDLRAMFPAVATRQRLADAQVVMNGWLMPAFIKHRLFGHVLWMLVQSYVLNPRWFRSRELRALHRMAIYSWTLAIIGFVKHPFREVPRQSLADHAEFGGGQGGGQPDRHPFAYLPARDDRKLPKGKTRPDAAPKKPAAVATAASANTASSPNAYSGHR